MTVQRNATVLPPHITRKAAYDRLVPQGSDSGYLHWLQWQRNEFQRLRPGVKGDEFHRLFDRRLEGMK